MAGINSVKLQKGSTIKTVVVGSSTYNSYLSQGYKVVAGSEVNAPKTSTSNTTSTPTTSSGGTSGLMYTVNGTRMTPAQYEAYKASSSSIDENYQLRQGETIDQYNTRVAAYNASKATTAPTTSPTKSTTSDALKNLSIGLASGAPITQESINSGALKPGGTYDYGGKTDLQNLSIGLAKDFQSGQAENDTFQDGESVYQTQPDGSANVVSGPGQNMTAEQALAGGPPPSSAGTATTSQNPSSAPMPGAVPSDAQYTKIDGAYFQQTPGGLLAVSDPNVIQGLRTGQIKADPQSSVGGGADRYVLPQQAAPATATTMDTISSKFGLPAPQMLQNAFNADPISTIKDMTKEIFKAMGVDQANSMISDIGDELEGLENDRDDEIREINDNAWLTEGVRLRQISKVEEKYEDKISNRVNRLRLLESTRDSARQQAQFALGTAISMWDSQQRIQQQQVQMYYDQAQREFDNTIELAKLSQKGDPNVSQQMRDYLYAVENGLFSGEYFDFISKEAGAGRAPTTSGGGGSITGTAPGAITDASGKPIKLTATQVDTISGFANTLSSAQRALGLVNSGVQSGPVEGRLLQGAKLFGRGDTSQLQLEQTLGKLKADFMKSLSGAAVSDAEVIRLSKFLPDIYDQENVIVSKLNTLMQETNSAKGNYLSTIGAVNVDAAGGYEDYLRSIGL